MYNLTDIEFEQGMVNSSKCEDVFETLDANNPYKLIAVTFSIFSIIFVTPAFYSIIWYEHFGSDKKRTLLTNSCPPYV